MGFFNKLLRKSDKTSAKHSQLQEAKKKEKAVDEKKKDLTIAELQERPAGLAKDGKKVVKEIVKKEDTKKAYKYLVRPMISEKGTYLGALNQYVFEVSPQANKIEIKKAIKAVYGVTPIKIAIINLSGKKVRYGRTRGETKNTKKAVITLKENEKIEVYEGV